MPSSEISSSYLRSIVFLKTVRMLDDNAPNAAFIGREIEYQRLTTLIKQNVIEKGLSPKVIRVFGPPGTGKTYTVTRVLHDIYNNKELQSVLAPWWSPNTCAINAAFMQTPRDLFKSIVQHILQTKKDQEILIRFYRSFGLDEAILKLKEKLTKPDIVKYFKPTILVVDEEDQLRSKSDKASNKSLKMMQVLTPFLQISSLINLTFILISNVLPSPNNSHQRVTRKNSTPSFITSLNDIVMFEPYSEQQLSKILDRRIQLAKDSIMSEIQIKDYSESYKSSLQNFILNYNPFPDSAKKLALKRITAYRGDCRQMLETFRHLIMDKLSNYTNNNSFTTLDDYDMLKQQQKKEDKQQENYIDDSKQILVDDECLSLDISETTTAPSSPRSEDLTTISFENTTSLLQQKFKKPKSKYSQLIKSLPLHHQILLCSICLTIQDYKTRNNHNNEPCEVIDTRIIQKNYKNLCNKYKLSMEFSTSHMVLEALSYMVSVGVLRFAEPNNKKQFKNHFTYENSHYASAVELLINQDDAQDILRESKQMFESWFDMKYNNNE